MTPRQYYLREAVKKIRQWVPRPKVLPWRRDGQPLRFHGHYNPSWLSEYPIGSECCPLGMYPNSFRPCPLPNYDVMYGYADVPAISYHEVRAFVYWWDSQKNARHAVDYVWGEEKE